jgi:hypothetical protein
MTLLLITLIAIAGAAVLRIGLHGRRIDDHLLCRRCGFDLTGKPADSHACAECGADLDVRHNVQIGHRKRLIGWTLGGALLLLVALLVGGFVVADRSRAIEWVHYMPVKWLLHQAQGNDASARPDALTELLDRARNGKFNNNQTSATVAVALTMQGDFAKPWDPLWGDIIEIERAKGQVTDQQWAEYALGALHDAFGFRVRPVVRLGDPLPYWIDAKKGRVASNSLLQRTILHAAVRFSETPLRLDRDGMSMGAQKFSDSGSSGSALSSEWFPSGLAVGKHNVHLNADVQVRWANDPPGASPLVAQPIDMIRSIRVQPATQPTVKAVPNPALASAIKTGLTIELNYTLGTPRGYDSDVTINSTPVALSFNIYVLIDGNEAMLGSFACPAGTVNNSWGLDNSDALRPLLAATQPGASGAAQPHATVIFRSDPTPAINSTDVFNYWDGQIVMKDVPITSR